MHHVYIDATCAASYRYLHDAKSGAATLRAYHPKASIFILPA